MYVVGDLEIDPDRADRIRQSEHYTVRRTRQSDLPFAGAADTRKHDGVRGIVRELTDSLNSALEACPPVNSLECIAACLQGLLDQIEHFRPVAENDTNIP